RGGERLHAGGDVMDLAVERQRQRAHGVAHPALGGLLLEPRVVEDQRRREQGHGDHRRDHQEENVIPKLHPASVRTTKMGGPEMAPIPPDARRAPAKAVARLDPPTLGAPGKSRGAPRSPDARRAPAKAVARLDPPTLGAPRPK